MTDPQTVSNARKWARGFALLAITLWVGSLWGVGFLAVPVLFQSLPDKMLAGMLAGKMFALVAYVGMGSASYLLAWQIAMLGKRILRQPIFLMVFCMLLLALAGEFILQPQMAALKTQALPADVMHSPYSGQFDLLHRIATGFYLVECVLGIALVLQAKRG